MDTYSSAVTDDLKKKSEEVQFALGGMAAVLRTNWNDLRNGCPERRGEIIARLGFEGVSLLLPLGKVAEASKMATLGEIEGSMVAKAAEISTVVREVPAVAESVANRISRTGALREVLENNGKLQKGAELRGTKFGVKTMEKHLGYETAGSIKYGSENGIDVWMKGKGANEGRSALVECKGGVSQKTLGCLKVDKKGLRCFERNWVRDRLQKGGRQDLIAALEEGKLDLFVTLEESGEVWKINPAIYKNTTAAASRVAGAAVRVFPP